GLALDMRHEDEHVVAEDLAAVGAGATGVVGPADDIDAGGLGDIEGSAEALLDGGDELGAGLADELGLEAALDEPVVDALGRMDGIEIALLDGGADPEPGGGDDDDRRGVEGHTTPARAGGADAGGNGRLGGAGGEDVAEGSVDASLEGEAALQL